MGALSGPWDARCVVETKPFAEPIDGGAHLLNVKISPCLPACNATLEIND